MALAGTARRQGRPRGGGCQGVPGGHPSPRASGGLGQGGTAVLRRAVPEPVPEPVPALGLTAPERL